MLEKEYYYLKYREDGKIQDKYIGKDPDVVADIRNKLDLRNQSAQMLTALKQEQKAIQHKLSCTIDFCTHVISAISRGGLFQPVD